MATGSLASFDWNLARSFLAALDQGSLSGAAKVLRTSQPTVGRHIAELESQLGVVLFERTGKGLAPTATGIALAQSARAMEAGALGLSQTVLGAQAQATGSVRITASGPVATFLLPAVLTQMRQMLPEIQVEVVASNKVSNLLRREADIAIRMVRPEQSSLIARKLGVVPICACAHKDYLATRAPLRQPLDLLSHTLIGSDTDTTILDGFKSMGYPATPAQFALRCDDFVVQWQAIQAGFGIGFAAKYMLRSNPAVQPVLVDKLQIPALPMWLAVHREIRTNPRIRAAYDYLASHLPELI
jgi:DNA-binding transcriptional LysR family regulator